MKENIPKKVKILFIIRVCLWITALAATVFWILYSIQLHNKGIFDPPEFARYFRPVFYTCLVITFAAILISFRLYAESKRIKAMQPAKEVEIWDLYDREGKRTGETFERKFGNYNKIPEGRYHLTVDLLVLHDDGTYLLTKRSDDKDVYPGYWEASAGGSAISGEEPLDAAKRELFEETGLIPDSMELINVLFKDTSRSIFYSYLVRVSCDKDSIVLQEGETTDYKWVDTAGLLAYVDSAEAIVSHNQRFEKYINTLRS